MPKLKRKSKDQVKKDTRDKKKANVAKEKTRTGKSINKTSPEEIPKRNTRSKLVIEDIKQGMQQTSPERFTRKSKEQEKITMKNNQSKTASKEGKTSKGKQKNSEKDLNADMSCSIRGIKLIPIESLLKKKL